MQKAEMVTAILAVTDIDSREVLMKKTVKQLEKIGKEYGVSFKEKEETEKEETETGLVPVNMDDLPEEPEPEAEKEPKETAPFISMCGMPFDPSTKGDCHTLCQIDNPDEFAKCLAHFKAKPAKPAKSPRKKQTVDGPKTPFGRRTGTQISLIEDCLVNKEPMTNKQIAEYANCTVSRVKRHWLKLIHKEQSADVRITTEGLIFLPERFPKLKGISAYIKRV